MKKFDNFKVVLKVEFENELIEFGKLVENNSKQIVQNYMIYNASKSFVSKPQNDSQFNLSKADKK